MAKSNEDRLTEAHELIGALVRALSGKETVTDLRTIVPKLDAVLQGTWRGTSSQHRAVLRFATDSGRRLKIWQERFEHGGVPGPARPSWWRSSARRPDSHDHVAS